MDRTHERAMADLIEAFGALRNPLAAHVVDSDGADIVVQSPNGTVHAIEVRAYRSVTPDVVPHIASTHLAHGVTGVVVADQITPAARDALADAGWGWLDRRGHLGLYVGPLAIDASIRPLSETAGQPATPTLETTVGLDVAVAILAMPPGTKQTVRGLAEFTGRSVGAVHRAMQGLKGENLIDAASRPLLRELFWEAADRWRPRRVAIAERPHAGDARRTDQLQLGLERDASVGWALTDVVASNVYGAPAPVRGDYPPDFYVPDTRAVRVARALYGEPATFDARAATVAVPPVEWACERRVDGVELGRNHPLLEFFVVHPVIAALDLAADPARGREILDSWNPPPPYVRVW